MINSNTIDRFFNTIQKLGKTRSIRVITVQAALMSELEALAFLVSFGYDTFSLQFRNIYIC